MLNIDSSIIAETILHSGTQVGSHSNTIVYSWRDVLPPSLYFSSAFSFLCLQSLPLLSEGTLFFGFAKFVSNVVNFYYKSYRYLLIASSPFLQETVLVNEMAGNRLTSENH